MSIPGLHEPSGAGDSPAPVSNVGANGENSTRISIPALQEWRFEVPFKKIMTVTVTQGTAEIFGTELARNVAYQFSGVKYAIYAPLDQVQLEYHVAANTSTHNLTNEDDEVVEYLSSEGSMCGAINLHFYLESLRQQAHDFNTNSSNTPVGRRGPRVLLVGPPSSGKTSLAKVLVSYAVKMGSTPVLVNVDPRDGVFSVPGSITATPISDFLDVEAAGGWGLTTTSGSLPHNPKQPLVKNIGFTNPNDNLDQYKYQISKLGVAVMSRMEQDRDVGSAGCVIDTPSFLGTNTLTKSFPIIENLISDFEVDHIVVVGNERLFIDLRRRLKRKLEQKSLSILQLATSGGCVDRDEAYIRKAQEESIREYFNGTFRAHLQPFKTDTDLREMDIYKGVINQDLASTLAFLPAGDSYNEDDTGMGDDSDGIGKFFTHMESSQMQTLENSLVAISHVAQLSYQPKDLLNSSVKGYIYVSKVDESTGKLKVLLPFPSVALPKNVLLATSIGYID
ncbi:mRNA cleavage and polyadenylation factor Clp1p [Diutina catenulata]